MDSIIESTMEQVRQLCEKGYIDNALPVLDKLIGMCPDLENDLIYEKAVLEFQYDRPKEALLDFIKCYENTRAEEVLSIILAYADSTAQQFRERYDRNRETLLEYQYMYGEIPEEPFTKILWRDERYIVYYDTESGLFYHYDYSLNDENSYTEKSVILVNVISGEMISSYMGRCREAWSINGRRVPVYLYYRSNCLDACLQCVEFQELLIAQKLVFIVGLVFFENFFKGQNVCFPSHVIGDNLDAEKDMVGGKLVEMSALLDRESKAMFSEVLEYYEKNGDAIMDRIKRGCPRILIPTTIFSTALQYHATSCSKSFDQLGIPNLVTKEERKIEQFRSYDVVRAVYEFKPDIMFKIDHFRFENGVEKQLSNLVVVSWIQDILTRIMTEENFEKLTDKDVLMTHLFFKEVKDLLEGREYIVAPVPADDEVYREYPLTEEEQERYGCDISMVCHASDVEVCTKEMILRLSGSGVNDAEEGITALYGDYYNRVYENDALYTKECFLDYVSSFFEGWGKQWQQETIRNILAEDMYLNLNMRVYRQVLADWLIEAGYDNIKLWGNGWKFSPKYTKYAMGPAENGEVLSKINQASKIVLGNNITITAATRVWETMLSGGFYLSNHIPSEVDGCDIRRILREGEDYVVFHDKQELLEKVEFYLTHEEERREMAQNGQKAAREKMTYNSLMKRIIKEIPEVLKKQGACD